MLFSYQRHWFPASDRNRVGGFTIYRPEILVRVFGPDTSKSFQALVDSGSDVTIFPYATADALGVIPDRKLTRQVKSASGHAVEVFMGEITLELRQGQDYYHWTTAIGFASVTGSMHEGALLGHEGFLEYFTATFDGKKRELSLKPNSRLPKR